MNNCIQLLEKADSLKKELTHSRRNGLNGEGEATSNRAELQDLYRQLLITNLEYALDKKIEQELWNFVFKNHITALQQQTKDKSNPKRTEIQNQLTVFLEAASGFYAQLLQDLCHIFNISLPCRVRASKLTLLKDSESIKRSSITQPERPSCQYMCQHCLVHLGDIARYRNQNGQAESYYRHAAQLVPSNGQPYNQLAILAAAGGDILSTAFYYCRSLAVKCPFPGSGTNLRRQLSKIIDGEEPRHQKISTSELVKFYLKFHACIYLRKYESKLEGMVNRLLGYIRAHLRAGSLSRRQLVHMAFLNLFSLNHLSAGSSGQDSGNKSLTVIGTESAELQENGVGIEGIPWNMLVSFTVRMLGALLACIPALSDDSDDLEHPALPAAKLTLDWFCENLSVLQSPEVTFCYSVWQRFAKVLNALGNQDKANNMDNRPLPEDLEVRGFVGLKQSLVKLDFVGGYDSVVPEEMQHPCRCYRLFNCGLSIANIPNALLQSNEEIDGTVFTCTLANEGTPEMDEEEILLLEKETASSPDSTRPSRIQRDRNTATTAQSGGGKAISIAKNQASEDKKDRARKIVVNPQNVSDSKLKSIQEEDSYQHDDQARSSTASSIESSCSSPSTIQPEPPMHHHKSTHHVTFAPMPPRHGNMSPDEPTHYKLHSPSPDMSSMAQQKTLHSPDSEFCPVPPTSLQYQDDLLAHQMQGIVTQGPGLHPLISQPGPIQLYPRSYTYPNPVLQTRAHVPYPMQSLHGITQRIPGTVTLRNTQLHGGANPPPNAADLPKPMFTQQRMGYPAESAVLGVSSYPNTPRTLSEMQSMPRGGNMDNQDSMSMYPGRTSDTNSNLARFAHLQQQQQQQIAHAQMMNSAAVMQANNARRPQIPTGAGLAARFHNQTSGMHFQPNLQQPKVDPMMNQDSNFEAYLNQQRKNVLQQQKSAFSQFGYPTSALGQQLRQENSIHGNGSNMAQSGPIPANFQRNLPSHDPVNAPYPYTQPPRSLYAMTRGGQPHGSSPVGSSNTSSTSSPIPVTVGALGSNGPLSSNTSPQAGTLPSQGVRGQTGPAQMRFSNQLEEGFDGHPSSSGSLLSHMRSNQQVQKPVQQPYLQSPTQNSPVLFGQESSGGVDIFRSVQDGSVQSARAAGMLPSDIFGISPGRSSNMAGFSVGSIGQSPSNSSPSDPFPPYPLSQERQQQIFEESLEEMLEQRSATAANVIHHQGPPPLSASDILSSAGTRRVVERHKQLQDVLLKEDDESYKLFPDTDNSWSLGRDNRNDSSLGLSNLGSIGSERAMAQQSHHAPPLGHFLPWGDNLIPGGKGQTGPGHSGMRGFPQPGPRATDAQFRGSGFESFWSAPMMPSGPSALEQLLRQQQQHAGHDKTPP